MVIMMLLQLWLMLFGMIFGHVNLVMVFDGRSLIMVVWMVVC